MARMTLRCEVAKEPRVFNYKDKEGLNLWVQDLDDSKLKLGLTGFDTASWEPINVGDQMEVVTKVSKRKNNRSGEWEFQFIIDSFKHIGSANIPEEAEEEAEGVDLPF